MLVGPESVLRGQAGCVRSVTLPCHRRSAPPCPNFALSKEVAEDDVCTCAKREVRTRRSKGVLTSILSRVSWAGRVGTVLTDTCRNRHALSSLRCPLPYHSDIDTMAAACIDMTTPVGITGPLDMTGHTKPSQELAYLALASQNSTLLPLVNAYCESSVLESLASMCPPGAGNNSVCEAPAAGPGSQLEPTLGVRCVCFCAGMHVSAQHPGGTGMVSDKHHLLGSILLQVGLDAGGTGSVSPGSTEDRA